MCVLPAEKILQSSLRLYRENDGYYDLDLTTQQETFLCKAQLRLLHSEDWHLGHLVHSPDWLLSTKRVSLWNS